MSTSDIIQICGVAVALLTTLATIRIGLVANRIEARERVAARASQAQERLASLDVAASRWRMGSDGQVLSPDQAMNLEVALALAAVRLNKESAAELEALRASLEGQTAAIELERANPQRTDEWVATEPDLPQLILGESNSQLDVVKDSILLDEDHALIADDFWYSFDVSYSSSSELDTMPLKPNAALLRAAERRWLQHVDIPNARLRALVHYKVRQQHDLWFSLTQDIAGLPGTADGRAARIRAAALSTWSNTYAHLVEALQLASPVDSDAR